MIKNVILSAWGSLKRKKIASLFTILTITLGMILIVITLGFYHAYTGNVGPHQQRDKCLVLTKVSFEKNGKSVVRYAPYSTSSFIDNYIKKMKTPKCVCLYKGVNNTEFNIGELYKSHLAKVKVTDANFWKVFKFSFIDGRPYTQSEIDNKEKVCIITKRAALYRFNDTKVAGKMFKFFNTPYKIVGVIDDPHPQFDISADFYCPYSKDSKVENHFYLDKATNTKEYSYRGFYKAVIVANEKSDFEAIKAEFNNLTAKMNATGQVEEFDQIHATLKTATELLPEEIFLSDYGISFHLIIAFIILIVLIPVIILSNINRYSLQERLDEIAVRKSFGANRITLFKHFLLENIFLTSIACILAVICAIPLFKFLSSVLYQSTSITGFSISWRLILYLVLATAFFGFLTGVIPILSFSKISPVTAFSLNSQDQVIRFFLYRKKRIHVLTYFCLFILLASSGAILSYMYSVSYEPVGYKTKNVLSVAVWEKGTRLAWQDEYNADRFKGLKEQLIKIEGIDEVSYVLNYPPFNSACPPPEEKYIFDGKNIKIPTLGVDTCFFSVLDIEPVDGELFSSQPTNPRILPAVISKKAERKFFDSKAIGKILTLGNSNQQVKIIGVIKQYKNSTFKQNMPILFLYRNKPSRTFLATLNPQSNWDKTYKEIDELVTDFLPAGYHYNDNSTLHDKHKTLLHQTAPSFYGLLLIIGFVLLNAFLGYFTLSFYNVRNRKKEMGIRRAVGANKRRIHLKILKENILLMLLGSTVAIIVIYQLKPILCNGIIWMYFNRGVYIAIALSVLITLLSTIVPASIAAKVQPVDALAEE